MSFSPIKGLVYIPAMDKGWRLGEPEVEEGSTPQNPGPGTASLLAWDPVAQKRRWEVRYKDSFWNGGVLVTAGNLVFQGTGRGHLIAYHAGTGEKLWSFYGGLGIVAPPITYLAGNVQYLSVLVGYGGSINFNQSCNYGWHYGEQPRRLLTFAVGSHASLPPGKPPRFTVRAVDDPAFVIDPKQATEGAEVYDNNNCVTCHGPNLKNIAAFSPDLRESDLAMSWDAFKAVVHDGAFLAFGMPRFDDLSNKDLRALYMYIRQGAREAARSSR